MKNNKHHNLIATKTEIILKITPKFQIKYTMHMLSRNKIKNPEEQKLGEGGDDKQVIKLMWPNIQEEEWSKNIKDPWPLLS